MYSQRREAEAGKRNFASVEEWIASLGTEVTFELYGQPNAERICQLLNKTNQMNLSTRRLNKSEMDAWIADPQREFWALRVRDRFGDAGLTGLVSLEIDRQAARIVDFVLSCRVMGRGIEEAMVAWATERAVVRGCQEIGAVFLPTAKNQPCFRFWSEQSGFRVGAEAMTFVCALPPVCSVPSGIRMASGVSESSHRG